MKNPIEVRAAGPVIEQELQEPIIGWDQWFFELADTTARKSKDRSTRVGCVIVGPKHEVRALGYNGFVRGADDSNEDWHSRPKKYYVTVHSELNAVCNAARTGMSLEGCTAYVTFPPCSQCVLALVQAGIQTIKYYEADMQSDSKWAQEYVVSAEICQAARVMIIGVVRPPRQ